MKDFDFKKVIKSLNLKGILKGIDMSLPKFEECPDIVFGVIHKTKIWTFYDKNIRINFENITKIDYWKKKIPSIKTIVIVLESPHKDEYEDFVNPALGTTGALLELHLRKLIGKISQIDLNSHSYRIILMNSIQYQCSLGYSTKLYRDIVFRHMWEEKIMKSDFSNRLKSFEPDVILNFCTKGKGTPNLQDLVQKEIKSCIKKNKLNSVCYKGPHPSSWLLDRYVEDQNGVKTDF